MSFQQAAWNYRKNALLTAPPEKLVVLLYERAIQNLEKARFVLRNERNPHSSAVGELRSSLDTAKGGDIARSLESLYEFATDQIMQANISRSPEAVENTLTVLRTLKEGWDGILARKP